MANQPPNPNQPVDWDKYRRIGRHRTELFLADSPSAATKTVEVLALLRQALEKELYEEAMQTSGTDRAQGQLYKDMIHVLQGRLSTESVNGASLNFTVAEARERFVKEQITARQILRIVKDALGPSPFSEAAGQSPKSAATKSQGGFLTSPPKSAAVSVAAPRRARSEEEDDDEDEAITVEDGAESRGEVTIPPPAGEDVVRQFEELRSAFNLLQKYKGVDMLNLKRKAEDRQRAIDPVWKKAKKQAADEKLLEERTRALAECEREMAEQLKRQEALAGRRGVEEEEDAAEHKGKMKGLWARYRDLRHESRALSQQSLELEDALMQRGLI